MISARYLKVRQELDSQVLTCRRIAQAFDTGVLDHTDLMARRISAYNRYWQITELLEAVKEKDRA